MKLYEIPRDSKILLPIRRKGGGIKDEICDFKHIDGMYSLIWTPDHNAVHLSAGTEVELIDGVYHIAKE